jgi:hypothetical protein
MQIDGVPLGPQESETRLGSIHVSKSWNELRKKGEVIETRLSYTVEDTFLNVKESTTQEIAQFADIVHIEVNLPVGRPCKSARVLLSYNETPAKVLPPPELRNNQTQIVWSRTSVKPGEQYQVEWEW